MVPSDWFYQVHAQTLNLSFLHKQIWYDMIYLLTAIGLTPGGSSTVHIYTQTIHRTTQLTNWEECGLRPVFVTYTLAFALWLRKNHGKTSVRVAKECQQWLTSIKILNLRIRENLLMYGYSARFCSNMQPPICFITCEVQSNIYVLLQHCDVLVQTFLLHALNECTCQNFFLQ